MNNAVLAKSSGLAWSKLTIFFVMPSRRSTFGDAGCVHSAIGEEAWRVVINHIEATRHAFRTGMVRKRRQVIEDRFTARLGGIPAIGKVPVKEKVDAVNIISARQRIGIGDVRRRRGRVAVAVAPED